ncbi:MAG: type II toxin-antitoxin system death-on-curing family toxin [Sphingosinicella sp.]|nr:type II toxin-antitoxin system death-on-curing family toxin [Sphingosinicella sp.]
MNISQSEPVWLQLGDVLEIHHVQLTRFGGADGIRDEELIQSAIARPQQLYHYEDETDILTLAIRLGVGISQNHGFVDGNKRAGVGATIEFLLLNGYFLNMPNDTTLGALFEAAVTGNMTEEQLADDLYPYIEAA